MCLTDTTQDKVHCAKSGAASSPVGGVCTDSSAVTFLPHSRLTEEWFPGGSLYFPGVFAAPLHTER